ncbi:MAG: hypothetical protein M0R30_00420 [Methanoregula sp.]|jgi:FKBP-type peptidyl-prolyl cis-trans isomerase 2|uniref:hypothetical protein n=1 Tax=Methanoregula sp. TaxID=2052170 RepID=UPI0025D1267A|nr:hypothetical protein [Methanoregula sp.]MCK9630084.1 hypothetical protein [Methanoregula sp.]
MGKQKQKEAAQSKWKKVLFVIAAVLFVFIMVVSSMGMNWITGIAPIKAGDQVVIDYTLYDTAGNPFMTSNEQLYKQQITSGSGILYTQQLTLTANKSLNQAIYPVPVYIASNGGSMEGFALYNPEYNAISNAVVGMRTGEKKKVELTTGTTMSTIFSSDDLQRVNVNMSELQVGESLVMGVSETPNATASNTTEITYLRLGQVTRITSAGAVVDFGYPYAEITVSSSTKQ